MHPTMGYNRLLRQETNADEGRKTGSVSQYSQPHLVTFTIELVKSNWSPPIGGGNHQMGKRDTCIAQVEQELSRYQLSVPNGGEPTGYHQKLSM